MQIMGCRYAQLAQAISGYERSGVPLVEFDGTTLTPSYITDDIGIYCIIPKMTKNVWVNVRSGYKLFFLWITWQRVDIGLDWFLVIV